MLTHRSVGQAHDKENKENLQKYSTIYYQRGHDSTVLDGNLTDRNLLTPVKSNQVDQEMQITTNAAKDVSMNISVDE